MMTMQGKYMNRAAEQLEKLVGLTKQELTLEREKVKALKDIAGRLDRSLENLILK